MYNDEDPDESARQQVAADRDAYAAARDITINKLSAEGDGQKAAAEYAESVSNLGSPSAEIRIAAIFRLQKASDDGLVESRELIPVLESFVRRRIPLAGLASGRDPAVPAPSASTEYRDAQEAIRVFSRIREATNWEAVTDWVEDEIELRADRRTDFSNLDFRGIDLRHASMQLCDLQCCDLSYANLAGGNLMGVNLSGATLSHSQISSVRFGQAYLIRSEMNCANAMNANFTMALLAGASLRDADLRGARFAGSYLSGMTLARDWTDHSLLDHPDPGSIDFARRQARQSVSLLAHHGFLHRKVIDAGGVIEPCDLRGADLRGADLSQAVLDDVVLTGAKWDSGTHWPPGFEPRGKAASWNPWRRAK